MPILKSLVRNPSKKILKVQKEATIDRISREMDEKEAKDIKEAKDKIINDKLELKRQAGIIRPYLDKLEANLKEKHDDHFWVFADKKVFKKIHMNTDNMKKMLKDNNEKYKNRPLVEVTIFFHQNEKDTSIHRNSDVWFTVDIITFYLDEKCQLSGSGYNGRGNPNGSINIGWKTPDFRITKFTMKFVKELMYRALEAKFNMIAFGGLSVSRLLKNAAKKGINLDDFLVPLAGV
jgi:hypothetical protein